MTETTESETPPIPHSPEPPAGRDSRTGRRLSLKPYGDELLTRSGDFWIFSARLIILAMALAEAIAWGYIGSLMSRDYPLLTAAIAGIFVFTLIWIIDTSFMTLDLRSGYYERAITGTEEDRRLEKSKLAAGVLARIAIVTASLVITAPFLAQAIFAGDVRQEMEQRNANVVASTRQQVEQPFLSRIEQLRRERRDLEQQRVMEAAGIGPSGRYGRGPALETIERQLSEKVDEIRALEVSRSAALDRFDSLSRPQLEQQFGVEFLSPGVHSSATILEDLSEDPQFGQAELAIRAFLAFLFLGLLILKAFQPRSISVYFSEQLHSLYDEYRKGIYDQYLPAAERAATGGSIDPLRFEDWCLTTYANIREEERQRRETASQRKSHELLIEQWQGLETMAREELHPLMQRYESALSTIHHLEEQIDDERSRATSVLAELEKVESSHESMMRHIERDGMDGTAFGRAMDAVKQIDERRRTLAEHIRSAQGIIESSNRRLDLRKKEAAALRQEIETRQVVIEDVQNRISNERIKLSSMIGNGDTGTRSEKVPSWTNRSNHPKPARMT
ncbi:MAG: hypothetical protein KY432_11985 [Acidobacteria bacterium]|nr:hypothetical protein [Acidobacteriota bacterium]